MNCELCELSERFKWFVVICRSCQVPMFVFREHREPTEKELHEATELAKKLFPDKKIDLRRHSIPSHPHFHCR